MELYKPVLLCQPAQPRQNQSKTDEFFILGGKKRSARGEEEAKNLEAQCHGLLDDSPLGDSLPLVLVNMFSC